MSSKPVYQKLQIKPGNKVHFVNPPPEAESLLEGLPENASIDPIRSAPADVLIIFANDRNEMEEYLPIFGSAFDPKLILWLAYHKGTSKIKTDIHRDIIWEYARTIGLDAVLLVSLNDDWSAMRLKKA